MIVLAAVRWLVNVLWVSCHLVPINNTGQICLHPHGEQSHSGTLYTTRAFYNNILNTQFSCLINQKVKAMYYKQYTQSTKKYFLNFFCSQTEAIRKVCCIIHDFINGFCIFTCVLRISACGTIKPGFLWFVLRQTFSSQSGHARIKNVL